MNELIDTMQQVRVIIADEHPVVLHAIEDIILDIPGVEVAGSFSDHRKLFAESASAACDLLIVDPGMAGKTGLHGDGWKMIRRFRSCNPAAAVIVMTAETNADVLQNLVQLGVAGVVSKLESVEVIRSAIKSALARSCYVGPVVRSRITSAKASRDDFAFVQRTLSQREQQVLIHYGSGLGISEIADRLGRSIKTVSSQKCAAMKKLALPHDADFFNWWAKTGKQMATRAGWQMAEAT